MPQDDSYSKKDSNKNRRLDERESNLTLTLVLMAAIICIILSGYYYYFIRPKQVIVNELVNPPIDTPKAKGPLVQDPKAPDESHPYDLSKPPHKQ